MHCRGGSTSNNLALMLTDYSVKVDSNGGSTVIKLLATIDRAAKVPVNAPLPVSSTPSTSIKGKKLGLLGFGHWLSYRDCYTLGTRLGCKHQPTGPGVAKP